ncbi:MAG: hypothetical protein ABSH49_24125 [Bryobacteraceae bacterium]|jgi:hypothetical protein
MTESEIEGLKLGEPVLDIAASPEERPYSYPVVTLSGKVFDASIRRSSFHRRWEIVLPHEPEFQRRSFGTPDEALDGLKCRLREQYIGGKPG